MKTLNATDVFAGRARQALKDRPIIVKRMFGGLTFMLAGNMLCCISEKGLMVRVGAAAEAKALARPHVAPCLGAGRRMAGFGMVAPRGFATDRSLESWLNAALAYVEKLPSKKPKPVRRR
ncbi:MAG: TfoX/Sxy family protein [Variibacter sp.]